MSDGQHEVEIGIDTKYEVFAEHNTQCDIKYYESSVIDYDFFLKEQMLKNNPCVIRNITSSWKCNKNWIKNNSINYEYFAKHYGDMEAPVADCDKINFNSQCKIEMKVKDYMSYLSNEKRDKLLYLKDWHLRKLGFDNTFYQVPEVFASDWLNEYALDNEDDDFMFVYIGVENTWTPFHADVYTSYSWSVNVVGRKKWILLPPGEEEKLKDPLGNTPLLFNPQEFSNVKYFEVIQERGDGIFVPSGWHHQVFNLLDTISINHNFANACNIETIWKSLQSNLRAVEKEIEEFRNTQEFSSQCQLILKSVFGMDFESFGNLIIHIAYKRIKQLNGNKCLLFDTYYLGRNHAIFDLKILLKIVKLMLNHHLFLKNITAPDILPKLLNIENYIETLNLD